MSIFLVAIYHEQFYNVDIYFDFGEVVVKYHLTKQLTLGGLTAALAVVIMCLLGILGITTYVCPLLCMILLNVLVHLCSARICWCWYVVVSVISLLLAPDKESIAVFIFIGYYPILRPWINQCKLSLIYKLLLFNFSMTVMYGFLLHLVGLAELISELQEFGKFGIAVLLTLGNIVFFLLDLVLARMDKRWCR